MTKRKDALRALLSGSAEPQAEPQPPHGGAGEGAGEGRAAPSVEPARISARSHTSAGAVKAMGLSLGSLQRDAQEAAELRARLEGGAQVLEIDPALIEPAFVMDRLSHGATDDEHFEALKASIEAGGQEVPVLLRPIGGREPVRYQTAYGHRRIAAARALGRPVRAIVRPLSDEELILAQGKENAERRDLSFIERAVFARAIVERGFERGVAQAALGLHAADMTRLLQVAEAIPRQFIAAVGPAPRVGRARWMELAELLKSEAGRVKAQDEIGREAFRALPTNERFAALHGRLARRTGKAKAAGRQEIRDGAGRVIAAFRPGAKSSTIEIGGDAAFAAFVAEELPALSAAFARRREGADD